MDAGDARCPNGGTVLVAANGTSYACNGASGGRGSGLFTLYQADGGAVGTIDNEGAVFIPSLGCSMLLAGTGLGPGTSNPTYPILEWLWVPGAGAHKNSTNVFFSSSDCTGQPYASFLISPACAMGANVGDFQYQWVPYSVDQPMQIQPATYGSTITLNGSGIWQCTTITSPYSVTAYTVTRQTMPPVPALPVRVGP